MESVNFVRHIPQLVDSTPNMSMSNSARPVSNMKSGYKKPIKRTVTFNEDNFT